MKTIIILFAVSIVLVFLILKKREKRTIIRPFELVELESSTQSKDYLPSVPKGWLEEIENKYKDSTYLVYPNEYTIISDKLCSEVYIQSKYWEKNLSHTDFLNRLTKEQRIFFSLVNFEGQTNNGGVYQFVFNQPELSLITLEAMKITKMDSLAKDYELVLHEVFGKTENISELRNKFQDNTQTMNSRWNAFVEGYKKIKSAEVIEEYLYEADFINQFRAKLLEYVKANQQNLYIQEV
jgi:hypothetical protein